MDINLRLSDYFGNDMIIKLYFFFRKNYDKKLRLVNSSVNIVLIKKTTPSRQK